MTFLQCFFNTSLKKDVWRPSLATPGLLNIWQCLAKLKLTKGLPTLGMTNISQLAEFKGMSQPNLKTRTIKKIASFQSLLGRRKKYTIRSQRAALSTHHQFLRRQVVLTKYFWVLSNNKFVNFLTIWVWFLSQFEFVFCHDLSLWIWSNLSFWVLTPQDFF